MARLSEIKVPGGCALTPGNSTPPRQAWRAALQLGWIEDHAGWLDMLDDRSRTSHTYNEHTGETIYARLSTYHVALATLLTRPRSITTTSIRVRHNGHGMMRVFLLIPSPSVPTHLPPAP